MLEFLDRFATILHFRLLFNLSGTKEQAVALTEELTKNDIFDALAAMMGKDLSRLIRQLAEEVLVTALNVVPGMKSALHKSCACRYAPYATTDSAPKVQEAIQNHQSAIQKRKRMDQEELIRKLKEQKQQQQFFEMMAVKSLSPYCSFFFSFLQLF